MTDALKLWLLCRAPDTPGGYDTYDRCVVAAATEGQARNIHPDGDYKWDGLEWKGASSRWANSTWTDPRSLIVREIGTASLDQEPGCICASFKAG